MSEGAPKYAQPVAGSVEVVMMYEGPLPDGRDIDREELKKLMAASWDGNEQIPSPFVEGDYLLVHKRPRISVRDGRTLWDWTTFNSPVAIDAMGPLLERVFRGWQLTGLDGQRIAPPARAIIPATPATEDAPALPELPLPWSWENLSTRVMAWVVNRAIQVVFFNPLA